MTAWTVSFPELFACSASIVSAFNFLAARAMSFECLSSITEAVTTFLPISSSSVFLSISGFGCIEVVIWKLPCVATHNRAAAKTVKKAPDTMATSTGSKPRFRMTPPPTGYQQPADQFLVNERIRPGFHLPSSYRDFLIEIESCKRRAERQHRSRFFSASSNGVGYAKRDRKFPCDKFS